MVSQGLALLGAGLPLSELLVLAREHDQAMREVAERAVDVFIRFVRDPIRAQAESEEEAAERLGRGVQHHAAGDEQAGRPPLRAGSAGGRAGANRERFGRGR